MSTEKMNIGIITFPMLESGIAPLSNLSEILYSLSDDFYIITGNAGAAIYGDRENFHLYLIKHKTGANILTRIINYICTELKISYSHMEITKIKIIISLKKIILLFLLYMVQKDMMRT